jgi:hypothetical protein
MGIAKQQLLVALASAVLTACGGGGGGAGGGAPPPPPPSGPASVNAAMAWRNFLTTAQAWTVSGVGSNGNTYTLALTLTPGTTQTFPVTNVSYATTTANATLRIGNLDVQASNSVSYFDGTTYLLAGTRNTVPPAGSTCSITTASAVPPASASIGSSGSMHTFNDLNGCLVNSASEGSSTTTWSVEAESGITYFCLNTTSRNVAGAVESFEADCVQTAADGTLGAKARITLSQAGGFTLVARN